MDEGLLNDLLECSVCLERLDTSSRVLPCQHTFCMKCLKVIVESHGELRCPECRVLVAARLDELPPNVLLMRILEGMRSKPRVPYNASQDELGVRQAASPQPAGTTAPVGAVLAAAAPAATATGTAAAAPRADNKPPPHARALYDYASTEPGDLSFSAGEVVLLLQQVDRCWMRGEVAGRRGLFPSNYVQVIVPLPAALCRALYDFRMSAPDDDGCLAFDKGAIISVLRRVDDNWLEGALGGRVGIFPTAFVSTNHMASLMVHSPTQHRLPPPPPAAPLPQDKRQHAQPSHRYRPMIETLPCTAVVTQTTVHNTQTPTHNPSAQVTQSPHLTQLCQTSQTLTQSSQTSSSQPSSGSSSSSTATSEPSSPPLLATVTTREKRHSLTTQGCATTTSTTNRHSLELLSTSLLDAPVSRSRRSERSERSERADRAERAERADRAERSERRGEADRTLPATYVALFPYRPQRPDELALTRGGLYTVTERCRDGWYKGVSRTGKRGVLPGNYVVPQQKTSTPVPSEEPGRAAPAPAAASAAPAAEPAAPAPLAPPRSTHAQQQYPWSAPPAAQPAAPRSDKSKEKSKDKCSAGVSLMKRLAAMKSKSPPLSLDNPVFEDVPAPCAAPMHVRSGSCPSQLLRSLPAPRAARADAAPPASTRSSDGSGRAAQHRKSQSLDVGRDKHALPVRERYRVVAPYPALSAAELELRVDDIVLVHRKRPDGWFRGTLARTGRSGLFPASFVHAD